MKRNCVCGGNIGIWATNKDNEHIYKDLGICIDCARNYLLTVDGYKFLSKAEFRRITKGRMNHMAELLKKYGRG